MADLGASAKKETLGDVFGVVREEGFIEREFALDNVDFDCSLSALLRRGEVREDGMACEFNAFLSRRNVMLN